MRSTAATASDGSTSGSTAGGSLVGRFDDARVFPFDQGVPLPHGPCTYSPITRGYDCFANQTTFTTPPMDLLLKVRTQLCRLDFQSPQCFGKECSALLVLWGCSRGAAHRLQS